MFEILSIDLIYDTHHLCPLLIRLANFITFFAPPPEKSRDTAFILSVLKRVKRWQVLLIRSILNIFDILHQVQERLRATRLRGRSIRKFDEKMAKWKKTVAEQRRNIYDARTMLS